MALSNPPAVIDDTALLTGLDAAVIRLRIGEETFGIPLRDIAALLDSHMPDFVTGQGELNVKEQTMRSGIKALIPMGLRLLSADVEKMSAQLVAQGMPPLPLPDLKARHADLLNYAVHYLAALILSLLACNTWEANIGERVGGAEGYLRLTGLSGGITLTPTPERGGDGPDAA